MSKVVIVLLIYTNQIMRFSLFRLGGMAKQTGKAYIYKTGLPTQLRRLPYNNALNSNGANSRTLTPHWKTNSAAITTISVDPYLVPPTRTEHT
jgi:hypothetical protein